MLYRKPVVTVDSLEPGADVLWRCEARRYSVVVDPEREIYSSSEPTFCIEAFYAEKRTPCGARLVGGKFVNLKMRKQWACNTQDEAIDSFIARRARQIEILTARLKRAKEDLELAQHVKEQRG